MKIIPYKHQLVTLKELKNKPRFFDMSSPGTGKTFVQIKDIERQDLPTLILATKSSLHSAWGNDFKTFAPHIKVAIITAENREKGGFEQKADVFITNHDATNWLVKQPSNFWKRFKDGRLISDEHTAFKHRTSGRSKALAKIIKHFKVRRAMSGLPDPNGVLDLWHQFYLLDDGERLGKYFYAFRSATCAGEQIPGINALKWTEKPNASKLVSALIADISIKHILEECVDMPEHIEYPRFISLSSKLMNQYQALAKDMILNYQDKKLTVVNKAALRIKLLQLTSGALYNESKHIAFSTERYVLTLDLVEEASHSIVFFLWAHQRDELVKEAKKREISYAIFDGETPDKKRTEITNDFQEGKLKVIFAQPQSTAHALTWTKGTRTIWPSPTDNYEHWVQGNRRIYRIGQNKRTETIVLVAENTWDAISWERLTGKALRCDNFSASLKTMLL